jgi:ubiquinone biosynthesis protein
VRVLLGVLLFVLFVVVVGKASGRLLGIRLGNARGALVGTIGWIAGVTAVAFTLDDSPRDGLTVHVDNLGQALGASALVVFFGVLAAMPVAIGIDLLTRGAPVAGRRRGRWWLHPIRAIKAGLAPYGRLREVIANARRANLLHWRYASGAALDTPDLGARVRTVLEESGGMMVKLGQIASTRNDVLPAPLTAELSKLRADVRPVGPDDVRAAIETELGEPVERAFASFEWEPLAAASIGQTRAPRRCAARS